MAHTYPKESEHQEIDQGNYPVSHAVLLWFDSTPFYRIPLNRHSSPMPRAGFRCRLLDAAIILRQCLPPSSLHSVRISHKFHQ
jgi:hypothetical protein